MAAEIVRNGLIGKITRVEVGLPSGHTDFADDQGQAERDAAAARAGLRVLDRALPDGAVHRGAAFT